MRRTKKRKKEKATVRRIFFAPRQKVLGTEVLAQKFWLSSTGTEVQAQKFRHRSLGTEVQA